MGPTIAAGTLEPCRSQQKENEQDGRFRQLSFRVRACDTQIDRPPSKGGLGAYTIRVLPKNADAVGPFWPPLVTWAGEIPVSAPEPVHT